MPKIYKICIYIFAVASFILIQPNDVLAIDGGYNATNIIWGVGRINSFSLSKIAEPFWGATTGVVKINGVPTDIASWGESFVNINVPSTVDGLGNIKVISSDGTEFNAGQLLISLRVDSYPQGEVTLGENIEITGNFGNTPGSENINSDSWPGRVANMSIDGFGSRLNLISWTDTKIVISTLGSVKVGKNTLKIFYGSTNTSNGYQSRIFDIQIKEPKCTADTWRCDGWNQCLSNGTRTMFCIKTFDCQFVDTPSPESETLQTCTPSCTINNWQCDEWGLCASNNKQTRVCNKTTNCEGGTQPPATTQPCSYVPLCYSDTWSCGNWTTCSSDGSQMRVCNKISDCTTADTPSPATSQNCTPPQPTCTADTWTCDSWGACSLSGIQSRNCSKTFDCPNIQTAPPITDQYCESPNGPQQITPNESEEITNQGMILKATVKLLCPVDAYTASQGSGTVIDSAGTILTNKHVIAGTLGCLVGFIDNFDDEPYFGDRQIADIVKTSSNQDIAVLKIRNPKNKKLLYVDVTKGSANFSLGTKITTYGYPAKFGTKVTYTSGDFSGTDEGYLKTTAILEYGNSGGGAYLKNGTYIGIPSAVVKGELNAMGYILSISTIRAWLNNSSVASANTNNNYSRVSVLEDIDLKKLGALKLFIPKTDASGNLTTPTVNADTKKIKEQPQATQLQKESVVIETNNSDKKDNAIQNSSSSTQEQPKQKISLLKRLFSWLANLFNKLATR